MNKNIKRILSYLIDIIVVSLIVSCLTNLSFINWQLDNYNKNYKEYKKLYNNYMNFREDLNNYYEDNKLTTDEYNELLENNDAYEDVINKYYSNDKLTDKNYDKLVEEVDNDFQKKYKKLYYNINKYSVVYNMIYILVILGYFVIFNIVTKGRTLGKRILGLKIVNNDNSTKNVSWIRYLIRALILYNPIYYLVMSIGVLILNVNNFYNYALILSNINNYLLILIVLMVLIRKDGRGLHELLSNTKVILVDKNGNELIDNNIEVSEVIRDDNNSNKVKHNQKKKKIIIDSEDKEK